MTRRSLSHRHWSEGWEVQKVLYGQDTSTGERKARLVSLCSWGCTMRGRCRAWWIPVCSLLLVGRCLLSFAACLTPLSLSYASLSLSSSRLLLILCILSLYYASPLCLTPPGSLSYAPPSPLSYLSYASPSLSYARPSLSYASRLLVLRLPLLVLRSPLLVFLVLRLSLLVLHPFP